MNKKLSSLNPALDNQLNFCLILLYGWDLSVKFFKAGNVAISGHIALDGVPNEFNTFVKKIHIFPQIIFSFWKKFRFLRKFSFSSKNLNLSKKIQNIWCKETLTKQLDNHFNLLNFCFTGQQRFVQ